MGGEGEERGRKSSPTHSKDSFETLASQKDPSSSEERNFIRLLGMSAAGS